MSSISTPHEKSATQPRIRSVVWAIVLGAVAIRWSYDVVLFVTMGREGLMGADSHGYLANAQTMVSEALNGKLHGWAWLGSDLSVMPLYPWLLAVNIATFSAFAPLSTVMQQGLIDAGTCFLVFLIARTLHESIAIPAAIAAALNPTQIILSGLLYNDTLFVFFVAVFLYAAVSWLRDPSWVAALALGFGLGLAGLDRIVVVPWVPVFAVMLLLIRGIVSRIRPRHIVQIAVAGVIFCLCVTPVLMRNVTQYDAWSLTPQGGAHLALWVAPLVREAKDGTPWARGSAEVENYKVAKYGQATTNPFTNSKQYSEIGREELAKLGLGAIVKAWAIGATINLAAPAIIISPPIAQLPRTGFFASQGNSVLGKVVNFLFHSDNATYAWALLLGIAGVVAVRLVQLLGLFAIVRRHNAWPITIVLALWTVFILATNGPIASPKYRLPIEPVLCVLTGAGICFLRGRRGLGETSPKINPPHTAVRRRPQPERV